ncbi:MAG TPA: hypothetical protein H9890_00490 [Candidatus Faecalibacterium intestinigallinarum]|uniref:VCBS repeat-containing protein n=1 Tax=Candidatus Faecalibacterium intestinigallinarum TaxID=2838581 RepID=A0A9D1Q897_9FIRM|nr:hypothetical protein [Candidatus Faecalibacterium intestinigallinarum]
MPGTERASVEELLRAPRLEGDYGEIQAALDGWLGQSAQLRYPLNGELLSPFLMGDFDGDGVQDAAVLYTATDVPNICLAVLQKDDAGAWQVQDAVEGLTDTVDTVRFARLQEGGADQIVVGYTAQQADSYLAVYAYQDGEIDDILAEPYDQYLVEDITGTGYEDLLVLDTDAQGASQIKLLTSDREGGFRQAAVMGLSADRYTGCASLAAGMGAYGGQYLVLDGWTGVSGANLASVLLRYNEQTQQMEPARQIGADALYEASLRNVPDLTSRDLDRDGVVEIPTQPEGAGLINMDQGRRMDFILWMDYTSAQPRKSFGLLDEELGFYLELPMEWYGILMLTDGPAEDTVELRSQDGEQLYLTVRVTGLADRTSGWTRLGVVSNRLVQAQFGPDAALNDPLYRLSRSFYIL